jgi:hypothetical protein
MNNLPKKPLIIISIVFLISSFIFINSCKKDPFCDPKSGESGIITSVVKFESCLAYLVTSKDKQMVIDSDSAYQKFIKRETESLKSHNCDTNIFPAIDFYQYTLLGLYATGGGCNVGFEKSVTKDEANKLYKYLIKVNECGQCDQLAFNMFWVLVPKLPQNYKVEFEVR